MLRQLTSDPCVQLDQLASKVSRLRPLKSLLNFSSRLFFSPLYFLRYLRALKQAA